MSSKKTVITTFKNEAPYILEWVAHQQTLGFDDIVVFTNDCTDTTNKLLRRLQELGHVHFHINRVGPGGVHRSALRQAKRLEVVQQSDWLFVTDIDEFLNIHVGDHKVDDLIAATPDADAIAIPWRLFSNNDRSVMRQSLVMEQFTDAELPPHEGGATRRFVKTLFRQGIPLRRIGLHGPVPPEDAPQALRWAVPGGARRSRDSMGGHVQPPFGYDVAQLNHYAVRSIESYLIKRHRGRANHMSHVLDTGYWDRWNRGGSEDTSIHRYLPEVRARVDGFLQDGDLARLHRKGFRWHKSLVDQLKTEDDYVKLGQTIATRKTLTAPPKEAPATPARAVAPLGDRGTGTPNTPAPIGSLWIGRELSYLEQMCLLSFVRQGHPVTLFCYGDVANVPQDVQVVDAREIHDTADFLYSKFGTPVTQSDIFRLKMIQQTDMIWADADMLCLQEVQANQGHVHGFFTKSGGICNALLQLPKDSPALAEYAAYTADPYPIPPWLPEDERHAAQALKDKGQWKHASEQAHDVYGPPALSWFLRKHDLTGFTQPTEVYYPVAFRQTIDLFQDETLPERLTPATRAVHLWGRRFRWLLPQNGIKPGTLVHNALRDLEINPNSAPLIAEKTPDVWSPAALLPRQISDDAIVAALGTRTAPAQPDLTSGLANMDAALRLSENTLRLIRRGGLYGIDQPAPEGGLRGIDYYDSPAAQTFALAQSYAGFAAAQERLPNLLSPSTLTEKLLVWNLFGAIPMPRGADLTQMIAALPDDLRAPLAHPDPVWSSDAPAVPDHDALPPGRYMLRETASPLSRTFDLPASDQTREVLHRLGTGALQTAPGLGQGVWWPQTTPRRLYLTPAPARLDGYVWKIWVIAQQVALIIAEDGTFAAPRQILHAPDMSHLPDTLFAPNAETPVPAPDHLDQMLKIALALAEGLEFAEIALRPCAEGLWLDGVDLCPRGGHGKFGTDSLDADLGALWTGTQLFPAP